MKLTIKKQLFLVIVIFVLLATVLLGSFMFAFFSDKMSSFMVAEFDYNIKQSVNESENVLKRIQNFNDYISLDTKIVSALREPGEGVVQQVYAMNSLRREYEQLFNIYFSDYSNIAVSSFIIDDSLPAAERLPGFDSFLRFEGSSLRRSTAALKEVVETHNESKNGDIFAFYHPDGPNCMFFGQRIYDNVSADGTVLGVHLVRVNFKSLFAKYNSGNMTEAVELAVLDGAQNVVVRPEVMTEEVLLEQSAFLDKKGTEGFYQRERIDRSFYQTGRYATRYGIRIFAFLDTAYITARLSGFFGFVILFVLIIIILLVVIANVIARRLSEPIVHLSNAMMSFDETTDVSLDEERLYPIEVSKLYGCFSHMIVRIKELLRQSKESGEKEKEMEMRMLNAQINPHFLYNALDSISWMAIDRGEDEIAEMLNILSESFRYSIKQVDELICVRDEMAFIIGYLQLQEMRYKNKFIFSLDISSEIEKMMIPKFVIQPLVENFVIHGMKSGGQNVLTISAQKETDCLIISVSDNGIGCDAEQLNRYIAGDSTVFPKEKIGTKNVNSRIQIKFGEGYGLSYEQNPSGGTVARLRLPIIE